MIYRRLKTEDLAISAAYSLSGLTLTRSVAEGMTIGKNLQELLTKTQMGKAHYDPRILPPPRGQTEAINVSTRGENQPHKRKKTV